MIDIVWSWLIRWLSRTCRRRPDLHFILYTRVGCHLCKDALQMLNRLQRNYGFKIETQDVDMNPDLKNRYDQCVPVVAVNGKVRFRGRINEVLVQRILDAPPES